MVARPDRHFGLKVLIGLILAMFLVDVLALTYVVGPLTAAQQKRTETPAFSARLTPSAVDQALILPTRDPQKRRPTRTPTPTVTPWMIPTATREPQRPPMPEPMGDNMTPAPTDAPGHGLTSGPSDAILLAMPSPATKSAQPVDPPSPTLTLPATTEATATLTLPATTEAATTLTLPATTEAAPTLPSGDAQPTETPDVPAGTAGDTPSPLPPPPITPGNEVQFETYVRGHYNTIAGQPLDIVAVTLDMADPSIPRLVVEVAGGDTNNVFAAQPAASVSDYGRRLLDDAKLYFSGHYGAITVVSTYKTSFPDVCMNNSPWCDLAISDQSSDSWTATWTYVYGAYTDVADRVEIWNAGP